MAAPASPPVSRSPRRVIVRGHHDVESSSDMVVGSAPTSVSLLLEAKVARDSPTLRPRSSSSRQVGETTMTAAVVRSKLSSTERMNENQVVDRRRAVSDAATYVRQRRRSELQRELLPAGSEGAARHRLEQLSKTSFCCVCSKLIWGFPAQGLRCEDCGIEMHRQCRRDAPACLGRDGSIASPDSALLLGAPSASRLMRICIASAEGLARRELFRHPDPFCVVVVDGERFETAVARRTLAPQWNTDRDLAITAASTVRVHVFDARKYREGEWSGFLGMCIVPGAALFDSTPLGEGATSVMTFRLKKRHPDDVVAGTIVLRVRTLRHPWPPESAATPARAIPAPLRDPAGRDSPMLATSPGEGWQALPQSFETTRNQPLLPPAPAPPSCDLDTSGDHVAVNVTWDGGAVTGPATGVSYTLAVLGADDEYSDIYTGHEPRHRAVGFKANQVVRFAVKAMNFFGSSDFSAPSLPVTIPETAEAEDDTQYCPLFMAGLCFRGASCPLSHGTGLQTADDVAAALVAAAAIADPDMQLAAALAASLGDMPRVEFDASLLPQYKRDFHAKEQRLRAIVPMRPGECAFSVVRADIFKSSFFEVSRRRPPELCRRLMVRFEGEGGLDYGGLAREWFYLVSHEAFHPSLGMFEYASAKDYALQISRSAPVDHDHLLYFQFVGRLLGLAIVHHHLLDITLTQTLCKRILGQPIALSDLEEVDPQLHRSLLWLLTNNVDEAALDMTFTTDYDSMGEIRTHELKPGGASIAVTEANKAEFVHLMADWRLAGGTEAQLAALLHGLHELVPRAELLRFTPNELSLLLSGTRAYDLEDWKANTAYQDCTASTPAVVWFWQVLEHFDTQQQAQFLQFATGTTRVPIEGFQGLQGSDGPRKFCIQLVRETHRLPGAHTCFNRLDLPAYRDKATLQQRLLAAMDGAEGFTGD